MSSSTLTESGTLLPRTPKAWRDECAAMASPAAMAPVQGGMACLTGRTVIDHQYLTRTGPSSCSPPV